MVIPFQIVVSGRGAGGAYEVRASASGRSAETSIDIPEPSGDLVSDGAALGQAVFAPAVRQLLMDVARGADEAGARIQIQLRVAAPDLAGLPWEWMSLGGKTIWQPATREDYALVRVGNAVRPPPALRVAPPLRLLIATAPGCDAAADALGAALASEVRTRRMIIDRLRDADAEGLADALGEEPCHLLHLIAPAQPGLSGGPARAALPRLRLGRNIDPPALAGIIAEYPDLRMVTLAADRPESAPPMAALASALHESCGLATLAIGALDAADAEFCAIFYSALAAGEPADLAATYGRIQLADSGGPWGTPQIFVGSGGETLFRIGAADPTPAPAPAPASRPPARPPRAPRPDAPRRPARNNEATQPVRPLARPQRPSLSGRGTAPAMPAWLTPRIIVLIIASLILIIMVSQSLRRPEEAAPTPPPVPTTLVMPTPWGTVPSAFPTPTR